MKEVHVCGFAASTGRALLAVDMAASALDAVSRRAERLGLRMRVGTIEASFGSLPLDDAEADALMSIDALLFDWDQRRRAIAARLVGSVDELANESGDDPGIVRQALDGVRAWRCRQPR